MEVIFVLLFATVAVVVLTQVVLVRRRRAAVDLAAVQPVMINGRSFDAAEVLWSLRQVNESPHLSTVVCESLSSSTQVVAAVNNTMAALPPDHASQVVQAQFRLERTGRFRDELLRAPHTSQSLVPALGDAAIVALAAHDPSPLADLVGVLMAHKAESMLHLQQLDQLPLFGHAADAAVGAAADQGAHLVGSLLDAHVPIVSIVMAIRAATKSAGAGLSADRVTENLAWDIGAKGGSIMAGAGIGTLVLPGIGTAIGGLAGAIGGALAATHGKKRHLRAAMGDFRASCAAIGMSISSDHLAQIRRESEALVDLKSTNLGHLEAELAAVQSRRSWYQRRFRPTVGLAVAGRAIELAYADILVDRAEHEAVTAALSDTASSPELRGYAWVASHQHLDWLDHDGPDPSEQLEALDQIRTETTNLTLAGH